MSIQQKNLAVMCALWLFYSFSYSTTYYVSTDGNDSWAGTSSSPWKTFNKAASSLQAGDTAIIKGGT